MEHISKAELKFIRSLHMKKFRDQEQLFLAEGEKCIGELSKSFELYRRIDRTNATPVEIEQISQLRSPQGVVAVFRQRSESLPSPEEGTLFLALDGVQDPGNLGTIIRTADWFGIRHLICSPTTADCYNPKVVQATMGALARVHLHYTDLPAWLTRARKLSLPVFGTLLDGRDIYAPGAIPSVGEGVIVMGNEGNGISDSVRDLVTHPLLIPPYPKNVETSESLNVSIATAVILSEFRRLSSTSY